MLLVRKKSLIKFGAYIILLFYFLSINTSFDDDLVKIGNKIQYNIYDKTNSVTGFVTNVAEGKGCCSAICQETSKDECFGNFSLGTSCNDIDQCNIGCCLDAEGYCLGNYPKGICVSVGGSFTLGKECVQNPICLIPKAEPLGYTGYNTIFGKDQNGVLFVEPISGTKGLPFTIKLKIFGENATIIKTRIISKEENYEKILSLYDDGYHNDGNANDGLYAGIWQSESFSSFSGIRKLDVVASVNKKQKNITNNILLSSNQCLPLTPTWDNPSKRRDVIFISLADQQQESSVDPQINNIFSQFISISGLQGEVNNINFYTVSNSIRGGDTEFSKQRVKQNCNFYDSEKDTIIFLNNNFEKCKQEEGVISVNPNILFNRTAIENTKNITDFINNFCKYALTQKQFEELVTSLASAPNITIINPKNNSNLNVNEVPVSFIINDNQNENLSYEIYLDINQPFMVIGKGNASIGKEITKLVNISDGVHSIWMEATDNDNNFAFSEILTITVNVSNFVIDITSLDPDIEYKESPNVDFVLNHRIEPKINYSVLINDKLYLTGEATITLNNSITTNLPNGEHKIQVIAKDNQNRTSESLPYVININKEFK